MSDIPERNLNPPKDDFERCPDCEGRGFTDVGDCRAIYDRCRCPRCHGDSVIPKAEERRELEAAMGDKEYDRREDDKWRREEEGK